MKLADALSNFTTVIRMEPISTEVARAAYLQKSSILASMGSHKKAHVEYMQVMDQELVEDYDQLRLLPCGTGHLIG
jgi:hypothetical protein